MLHAGHSLSLKIGAGVVQAHMWCAVALGGARHDCFSQCIAGANVVPAHMSVEVPIEK